MIARRTLVIMVKEPVFGRVKTRLSRDIGPVHAVRFYRHALASVTARLAADTRWQTQLSVAPAGAVYSTALPLRIARVAQRGGDLGQRMQAIFNRGGGHHTYGPTIVIGTDIPEVRPADIAAAFDLLGSHEMVFGPATDGGFWLVGMRRSPRVIDAFPGVRWSTASTLQDCLHGLAGYRIAMAKTLRDVDDCSDMSALGRSLGRRILPR